MTLHINIHKKTFIIFILFYTLAFLSSSISARSLNEKILKGNTKDEILHEMSNFIENLDNTNEEKLEYLNSFFYDCDLEFCNICNNKASEFIEPIFKALEYTQKIGEQNIPKYSDVVLKYIRKAEKITDFNSDTLVKMLDFCERRFNNEIKEEFILLISRSGKNFENLLLNLKINAEPIKTKKYDIVSKKQSKKNDLREVSDLLKLGLGYKGDFTILNFIDQKVLKLREKIEKNGLEFYINQNLSNLEKIIALKKYFWEEFPNKDWEQIKLIANEKIKNTSLLIKSKDIENFLKQKKYKKHMCGLEKKISVLNRLHHLLRGFEVDEYIKNEISNTLDVFKNTGYYCSSFWIISHDEEANHEISCYNFDSLKTIKCFDSLKPTKRNEFNYTFLFKYNSGEYFCPYEIRKGFYFFYKNKNLFSEAEKYNIIRTAETRLLFLASLEEDFEKLFSEEDKKIFNRNKKFYIEVILLSLDSKCIPKFMKYQQDIIDKSEEIFEQVKDENTELMEINNIFQNYIIGKEIKTKYKFYYINNFLDGIDDLISRARNNKIGCQQRLREISRIFPKIFLQCCLLYEHFFENEHILTIRFYLNLMNKIESKEQVTDFKELIEKLEKYADTYKKKDLNKEMISLIRLRFTELIIYGNTEYHKTPLCGVTIKNIDNFVKEKVLNSRFHNLNATMAEFLTLNEIYKKINKDSFFRKYIQKKINDIDAKLHDNEIKKFINDITNLDNNKICRLFSLSKLANENSTNNRFLNIISWKIKKFLITAKDIEDYLKDNNISIKIYEIQKLEAQLYSNPLEEIRNATEIATKEAFEKIILETKNIECQKNKLVEIELKLNEILLKKLSCFFPEFLEMEAKKQLTKEQSKNIFINLLYYLSLEKDNIKKTKIENAFLSEFKDKFENDSYIRTLKSLVLEVIENKIIKELNFEIPQEILFLIKDICFKTEDSKFLNLYLRLEKNCDDKIEFACYLIKIQNYELSKKILGSNLSDFLRAIKILPEKKIKENFIDDGFLKIINREGFLNILNIGEYINFLIELSKENISIKAEFLNPILKFKIDPKDEESFKKLLKIYFLENNLKIKSYNSLVTYNHKELLEKIFEQELLSKEILSDKDTKKIIDTILKIGKRKNTNENDVKFLYKNLISKTNFLAKKENRDYLKGIFKQFIYSCFEKSSINFLQDEIDKNNFFDSFGIYLESFKKRVASCNNSEEYKEEFMFIENYLEKSKENFTDKSPDFFKNLAAIYDSRINYENREKLLKKFNILPGGFEDYKEDSLKHFSNHDYTFLEKAMKKNKKSFLKDVNHLTNGEHFLNENHILAFLDIGLNIFNFKDRIILYKIITTGTNDMTKSKGELSDIFDIPINDILENYNIRSCWDTEDGCFKTAFIKIYKNKNSQTYI